MSQRAKDLADAFDSVAREVMEVVSDSTDEEWLLTAPDGDWTVAFEAYHIAMGMAFQHRWISTLTAGESIKPLSLSTIDGINNRDARRYADIDRATVSAALGTNRQLVHDHIASLTDTQLEMTFPQSSIFLGAPADETFSIDWCVEFIYIGHPLGHLERIHDALDAARESAERIAALRQQFDAHMKTLESIIDAASDDDWSVICPEEDWTVGYEIYHVADWLEIELDWIGKVLNQRPMIPLSWDTVNAFNDRHAAEFANVSRETTRQTLVENQATVNQFLKHLDSSQLDLVTPVGVFFYGDNTDPDTMTGEEIIQAVLIRHSADHLRSIQEGLGAGWFEQHGISVESEAS